jgi:hypothetical protein
MRVPQHSDIKNHYVSLLTVGSAEKLKNLDIWIPKKYINNFLKILKEISETILIFFKLH